MPSEVELKLLLPGTHTTPIARLLAQVPALAGQPMQTQWLLNRYYDTPDHLLRRLRAALRLRQIRPSQRHKRGTWVQTFKTAGVSQGGLSQRGEWEHTVAGNALDPVPLAQTPWAELDPKGRLLPRLVPCFETHCQRSTWQVVDGAGNHIEVALDQGHILAGQHSEPLLELELELVQGQPAALFALAQQLAQRVGVLPFDASKAERGYALAQGTLHTPVRAQPTRLNAGTDPTLAAQQALAEMLQQFTRNLAGLAQHHHPELVHQARVAWRRWRSATRLFRTWLPALPNLAPLKPLLVALGQLRDLDVARTETLPQWAPRYAGQQPARRAECEQALQALNADAQHQLATVRQQLAQPSTGQALLALTSWLHSLGPHAATPHPTGVDRRAHTAWARERMGKLHRRLEKAMRAAEADGPGSEAGHAARLLAKRARYGVETLAGWLPERRAQRWAHQATEVQHRYGAERDLQRAAELLAQRPLAPGLAAFLEGVAAAAGGAVK